VASPSVLTSVMISYSVVTPVANLRKLVEPNANLRAAVQLRMFTVYSAEPSEAPGRHDCRESARASPTSELASYCAMKSSGSLMDREKSPLRT